MILFFLGESGERQLFVLAQVWDRFFSEILPTLQAILYPLQVNKLGVPCQIVSKTTFETSDVSQQGQRLRISNTN